MVLEKAITVLDTIVKEKNIFIEKHKNHTRKYSKVAKVRAGVNKNALTLATYRKIMRLWG